jgi:hypothetical protein
LAHPAAWEQPVATGFETGHCRHGTNGGFERGGTQRIELAEMVSVFLWQQGRFKRFLDLIAAQDKAGYPTYLEAAMEMPIENILPLWQDYLNDAAAHRMKNLQLPVSSIFEDGMTFTNFMNANGISLEQPIKRAL